MAKEKEDWRWLKITCGICFGVLATIILYFGGVLLQVECWCPKLEVKEYTEQTNFEYDIETTYSIGEIKALLDNDFRVQYFYKVEKLHAGAITYFQIRLIKVDTMTTRLKPFYAYAMAHELTHLKYMNGNECWTEFNAWKYLYESNDPFLHNVALWRANDITQNKLGDAYDCGYYILNYLELNKEM